MLLCFVLAFTVIATAKKRGSTRDAAHRTVTAADTNYVSALAAANRFLYAWQSQDEENGVLMLTDAAKNHTSEDRLDAFFSPAAGSQQTYEITRGKRLAPGRYLFPVTLVVATPGNAPTLRRRYSRIVITKAGDDWVVDRIP